MLMIAMSGESVSAQDHLKDSSVVVHLVYASYGFGMPGADLAERFGFSHQIGGGYQLKTKSGWNFSIEGNFLFRDVVKNPSNILSGILTHDGFLIDESGVFANIMLQERGFTALAKMGKLFPIIGPNPNSGLMLQLGGGMMQHKIKIEDPNNSAPQIKGGYAKGYDHLCSGPTLVQYIGYQHLDNKRRYNFYAGFEFLQAFTQSRRMYYFNEMKFANEKRIDLLSSIKIGWFLPINRKSSEKYYYF
jgi:hypothetical protein